MGLVVKPPTLLSETHNLENFNCEEEILNEWLKKRALKNQLEGASRTYVIQAEMAVIGYYCLSAGAVENSMATGSLRRNMPEPIPIAVLGRLAIDVEYQGVGMGRGLLKDSIMRTLRAASIIGIRALLVQALDENAKKYYKKYNFVQSPLDSMTLMLGLKSVAKLL